MGIEQELCRCGNPATQGSAEIVRDTEAERRNDAEHLQKTGIKRGECAGFLTCQVPGHWAVNRYTGRTKHWCDTCDEPAEWSRREKVTA